MPTATAERITLSDLSALELALARSNLIYFTRFTCPTYQDKFYHRLLAKKLDLLLAGKIKRLMVFMPPQRGKTELVSRRLTAYALGKQPKLKIAGCAYSSDRAEIVNREIQRIIDTPEYEKIFPETKLNARNVATDARGSWLRNSSIFEVCKHGGSYKSVGVMGPLTGNSVDLGIIDDPIKDRMEAVSETFRNRLWEWYIDVFCTRLHGESRQLLTMTRWHEDDLAGRLLEKERDRWDVLSLPEIKEDESNPDDPRKIGEPLWPEKHPLSETLAVKANSERTFIAMYQQRPAPSDGGLFKQQWFRYYYQMPARFDRIIQSWDCTFKDTSESDFVVGTIWGKIGANCYLLGYSRGQWDFVETVRQIQLAKQKFPSSQEILIEEKANGAAVIYTLKNQVPGLVPICPTESKESRAYAISFVFESGNVFFPANCPWVSEIENELKVFNHGKYDDIVDSVSQALRWLYLRHQGKMVHMGGQS